MPELEGAQFNYPEVGATAGAMPAGYDTIRRERLLGAGPEVFAAAATRLLRWDLHRRSGLSVSSSCDTVTSGCDVRLGIGVGRARLGIPCRVVHVVDETRRQGFAYGTLRGHPEAGEEQFVIELREGGGVAIVITAFSRPALWWSRLGRPVGRKVQAAVTTRYLNALRDDG
jgi:uncharacterized protein (UPF0548 family)